MTFDTSIYRPRGWWRHARKMHVCHLCGQAIHNGARYWEDMGSAPAHQSGYRYHPDCIFDLWPILRRENSG